jgi:hypothetical protein
LYYILQSHNPAERQIQDASGWPGKKLSGKFRIYKNYPITIYQHFQGSTFIHSQKAEKPVNLLLLTVPGVAGVMDSVIDQVLR